MTFLIYLAILAAIGLLGSILHNQSTIKSQLADISINIGILQRRGLLVETSIEEMGNTKLGVGLDLRFNDRRPDGGV